MAASRPGVADPTPSQPEAPAQSSQPTGLHMQSGVTRFPQPAVRSVGGVHLPSWAVVGGSHHVAPSKEPALGKSPAPTPPPPPIPVPAEDQRSAYMRQHQAYLQQQEQQRNEQLYQREQAQAQAEAKAQGGALARAPAHVQAQHMDSRRADAAHDMLMARAVVQPQARGTRLGAAGALGYTDAGPVVAGSPYAADLIGMARQDSRQPLRASRRSNRLGPYDKEQRQEEQQPSGEGFGLQQNTFGADGPGWRRTRTGLGKKASSVQHKYAIQTDTAAEAPAAHGHELAPRVLPSLGGLAMGFGGRGPLHGRRSVLGT